VIELLAAGAVVKVGWDHWLLLLLLCLGASLLLLLMLLLGLMFDSPGRRQRRSPLAAAAAAAAALTLESTLNAAAAAAVLQPKKKVEKKYANKGAEIDDTPLDDPIAERLRKQRLEEEADMRWVCCFRRREGGGSGVCTRAKCRAGWRGAHHHWMTPLQGDFMKQRLKVLLPSPQQ
jgi:hypothetical protein